MYSFVARLTLVAALVQPAALSAQPVRADWTATGKWVVNFEDNLCLAVREYRLGNKDIRLGLESVPFTSSLRALLETKGTADGIELENAKVDFEGKRQTHVRSVMIAPSARPGYVVYSFSVQAKTLSELSPNGRLEFRSKPLNVDLPLAQAAQLAVVLNDCVADLLASWGFSREQQRRVASLPTPLQPLHTYIRDKDYPKTAIGRGGVGRVQARVTVRADGAPVNCRIMQSSGHPDLDATTCSIIVGRAKYRPASDLDGEAIDFPHVFTVNWLISSVPRGHTGVILGRPKDARPTTAIP